MSKKQDKQDKVVEPPGLQDISTLSTFLTFSCSERVDEVACFLARRSQNLVWQADAQFAICSVTVSKTKFYHPVAVLPQEVASQILDLIRAPHAGDPYGVLREHLIMLYTLNDYQRFEALVSLPLSGDQKPSYLMNRMLALLPDNYKPDFILTGLFLRHLPIDVWSHLLHEKVSVHRALALKADELYQSRVPPSSVNLLSDDLSKSLQVNLDTSHVRPPKSPLSTKIPLSKRSPTPAPTSRSLTPPGACWFHKKHGEKALNCRKPCSMLEN